MLNELLKIDNVKNLRYNNYNMPNGKEKNMDTYITKDYKGRVTLAGMSHKDSMILARMMNTKSVTKTWETVAEYIERTGCKTEKRVSKKGTELIKVFYENGTIKEYPLEYIDRTTACDIPPYNMR